MVALHGARSADDCDERRCCLLLEPVRHCCATSSMALLKVLLLAPAVGMAAPPPSYYTRLMGVLPSNNNSSLSGPPIATGTNRSLRPCEAACDALPSCQGFSVGSWLLSAPRTNSSCWLHAHIEQLEDAPCGPGSPAPAASAAQLSAFFSKVGGTGIPGPAPYQQFAGLMAAQRGNTAATVRSNGNWSMCTDACDADSLCVGIQLFGCSPEAPGPFCWTLHAGAVPSLVANTLDHACYYQKPGAPDVPVAEPLKTWTCHSFAPPPPLPPPPYGGGACADSWDCSLAGECVSGKCVCDPQYTGSLCAVLRLRRARLGNGMQANGTHTWGGHALKEPSSGKYVGFFSYMAGRCDMRQWATNSMIVRAVSDEPDGPFSQQLAPVTAPWTHNAMISRHPNGSYFLFHIGTGGKFSIQPCSNESDPFFPFPAEHPQPANATTHIAESLLGPWRPAAPGIPALNNPAPFFFPNGTTLLFDANFHGNVVYTGITLLVGATVDGPWSKTHRMVVKMNGGMLPEE